MTFEKKFPSLKPINQSLGVRESWKAIDIEQVMEHCLDKQRVREKVLALEEEWFLLIGDDDNDKARHITKTLLKELLGR